MSNLQAIQLEHDEGAFVKSKLLESFSRLWREVTSGGELEAIFALAARTAADVTEAKDAFVVAPVDFDTPDYGVRACVHEDRKSCHASEDDVRELALVALTEGTPTIRGDLWAVPFQGSGRLLGVLVVAEASLMQPSALDWLHGVADQVSNAMQREKAHAEKKRHLREFDLLDQVARDCAELSLDELLPSVMRRICETLNAPVSTLLFVDDARDELVVGAVATLERFDAPRLRERSRIVGLAQSAISSRQPVHGLASTLALPDLRSFASLHGLACAASVPLVIKDRAVGVFSIVRSMPFGEDDLRLVAAFGTQVAVAVDNARLVREATLRANELEAIQSAAEGLTRSLDSTALVGHAFERLSEVLECEVGSLYLLERGAYESIYQKGMTVQECARSERVKADEPLIGDALASGVAIERAVSLVGDPGRTFLSELGLVRVAAAPLLIVRPGEPDAPGVVLLGRRVDRAFAPDELRMISAVTSQLAVALQNAWLFEETQRRMEEMSIVVEAGGALARRTFERDALDAVCRRLAALLKVQVCTIFTVDEEERTLVGRGTSCPGNPSDLEAVKIDLRSDALGAAAARTGKVCHLTTTSDSALLTQRAASDMPAFVTAIPLLFADRTVAVLYVTDNNPANRLRPLALERVMALGAQMAVAIERTRLFNALEVSLSKLAEAQRELVKSERLAALGEMAALVAHEIRNPLGVIFNSLGALGRLFEFEGDALTAFRILREEADRLNRIVGDMLDYTRPLRLSRAPVVLDRLVKHALESATASERLRGTPIDSISIVVETSDTVPGVRVDEQLVHQAVVNLLSNAMQSAGDGGSVWVRMSSQQKNGEVLARVEVEDDGAGLSEEMRERLFEPFVTSKATGSGLGLAVVQRVIDAHDGEVFFTNGASGGMVFGLDFPVRPLPSAPDRA